MSRGPQMSEKWPTQDPKNYQGEKAGHCNRMTLTLASDVSFSRQQRFQCFEENYFESRVLQANIL